MPARSTALDPGWFRITTDCVTVGLRFPPHDLQGRLAATPNGHLLTATAQPAHPGTAEALARWLRLVGAIHVEVKGGTLRARFTTLPDSVDIVAREARVDEVAFTADGTLSLTCLPPKDTLEGILAMLDTRPQDRDGALTPRQEELLEHCVAAGYYAIPREVHLRGLAEELGVSMPTLSLALRRAEAKVIAAYVGRKRAVPGPGKPPNQSQEPRASEDTTGLGPGVREVPPGGRRPGPPSRL